MLGLRAACGLGADQGRAPAFVARLSILAARAQCQLSQISLVAVQAMPV